MKKLSFLLLAALVSFMFVACDDNGTSASNSSEKESVASRVDTVYVFSKDTIYSEKTVHSIDTLVVVIRDTSVVKDSVYFTIKDTQYIEIPEESPFGILHDGSKYYRTVKIGNQIWYGSNVDLEAACAGGLPENCLTYGSWVTPARAQTVCPNGWHLPDTAEWNQLFEFVGPSVATLMLKSSYGWQCNGSVFCDLGHDSYGFTMLPSGMKSKVFPDAYQPGGSEAVFLTPNKTSGDSTIAVFFSSNPGRPHFYGIEPDEKASVRCIKDSE